MQGLPNKKESEMIKAVIKKLSLGYAVELYADRHYFATIYADKVEVTIGRHTGKPFLVIDELKAAIHPDEVEDEREK